MIFFRSLFLMLCLLAFINPVIANNTAENKFRLLVLGDSLTSGYGLPVEDAFPSQLKVALNRHGHRVEVINAGVSGDTTAGGLARLDWSLADNPDLVIVELGANDAIRGLSVNSTRNNLDQILSRLKDRDVPVLLAGMKAPRNMGDDYAQAFDGIYEELAEKYQIPLYPFFLDGVALVSELNQPDGIHPNAEGVEIIVFNILPYIVAELKKIK